ncbi:1-deoxy-D-xylulose-5-phosphate synthase, partial [Candidatus Dependentiae bacterium]|nr:1-deoxy-D-xylulose-5-phosphate synthase [Candidatus Dependentiae bacterium]
ESDPTKFHGLGQFDVETGESSKPSSGKSYSKLFGETLTYLAKEDEKIIAITAAMAAGTGLDIFANELPDQFFDVGIAEQHAITFAAGLAIGGYKPVAAIYSSFMQRCYDQVIHDAALQHLPVKIFMDRAGLVGEDGETHQGMFDISFMRAVPDLVFMAPKDGIEFQDMIYTSIKYDEGPTAVRFPRGNVPNSKEEGNYNEIPIGKAEVLREGKDVMIFAIGNMVLPSIEIADDLKKHGVDAGVVNARFIKPIDKDLIIKYLKAGLPIATIEDNTLVAGFGSAVLEVINESGLGNKNVINFGLPDQFIEHGSVKQLFEQLKLDNKSVVKAIIKYLK